MKIMRFALSVFLTVSLLAPSLVPLPLLAQAQPGSPENPSNKPSEQGEGGGSGTDAAAEATAQAETDAATAASYGMPAVDVDATAQGRMDGTIDADQVVTNDGEVQSLQAGKEAHDAITAAQDQGVPVDAAATRNAYQNPASGIESGQVVGIYGHTGLPSVVRDETIAAQAGSNAMSSALFSPNSLTTSAVPITTAQNISQAIPAFTPTLLDTTPIAYQTNQMSISLPGITPTKEVEITTYTYDANSNSFKSDTGESLNMNYMDAIVNLTQMANPYGTLKNNSIEFDPITQTFVFTDNITNAKATVPVNQFSPINSVIQARTTLNQQIPAIAYTPEDLDRAVRMAISEAQSIRDEQGVTQEAALQQALEVARNRVMASGFPNTLTGVVNQNRNGVYQFEVVKNGSIDRVSRDTALYAKTEALAKAVFDGVAPAIAVNSQGQGHLNFANVGTVMDRPSSGAGVTASRDTKAGFSNLGATREDVLHTADARNPGRTSHTSGFMHNRTTGAPDFTTGYTVTKPDFTAAVNMGRNVNAVAASGNTTPSPSAPSTRGGGSREFGAQAGSLLGGLICGSACSSLGGNVGGLLGGLLGGFGRSSSGGTPIPSTGDTPDTCPLYPAVDCSQQAALAIHAIMAVANIAADKLINRVFHEDKMTTNTDPISESPYVTVVLTIRDETQEIEVLRPDIIHALASNDIDQTTRDHLRNLLNETALLLDEDGSVLYSNGLYSPPVREGQVLDSNAPRYVYLIERTDENGTYTEVGDEQVVNDGILQRLVRRTMISSIPFFTTDVRDVRYRLVDPDQAVPGDEYYDYVVTLNDGNVRAVVTPRYSSIKTINERFAEIGYQGQALDLLALATEDTSEPPRGLLGMLLDWGASILNLANNESGSDFNDMTSVLPSGQWNADNIEGIFIYPDAIVSCYEDVTDLYRDGFVYSALVRDGDELYMITEGLCGDTATSTLAINVANRLAGQFDIRDISYETVADIGYIIPGAIEESQLSPGITKLYLPSRTNETGNVEEPSESGISTSTTPTQLPNLTNTITFEVKAVGSSGTILADWSSAEKITIAPGVQLYFRWSGSDYSQCLPFLNDNGNYSLTVRNRAMTTGNTESEGYNINERSGVYRIECGGQRNNEFGVDSREIEVVVE